MAKKAPVSLGHGMLLQKNMQHNAGIVNFIGVFGALVAGLIAGIWGVTGWGGLLYYLAMQMVVACLLFFKTGGQPKKYFQSSGSIFYGEIFNSTLLLTFILFWTVSHNYVHLF
ncbi:probable ER membrane protein complex subunit 6 [Coccomyxa sp. Obi]|nr:probable ER membrane protein complex subunit 6 [Coccomyxa sp. Obi]